MTGADFQAILPLEVLSAGAILIMLQIAFFRNVRLSALLTVIIFTLAILSCLPAANVTPIAVTPLLQADKVALLFCALFSIGGLVTTLLSIDYINRRGDEPEEYFLLLLLSTLGACVLAYSVHLVSLFLGMELLSIALYALIAYPDKSILPLEAAIKYLVLSGAASATMLFGFALIYATTGTLAFGDMGNALAELPINNSVILAGGVLILSGLAFKLSLVPFHLWTPDVYQGAPSPVTGFLASVSKAAVFLALLRWFLQARLFDYPLLIEVVSMIAILSMLIGNLLALQQQNIKRLLAYSSIAHMGYLLIILVASASAENRPLAIEASLYYLIAYTTMTLAAFGMLSLVTTHQQGEEETQTDDISGLFWRQPILAILMLVALLSLAGIPLTTGFIAKFYIFSVAVSGYYWALLSSLIVGSGIGIYYYLRVIFSMTNANDKSRYLPARSNTWHTQLLCYSLIACVLLLGTIPAPLMEYIRVILYYW